MPITKWSKDGIVYQMVEVATKEKKDFIKNNPPLGCVVDDRARIIYFMYGVSFNPKEAGLSKVE